MIVDCSLRRVFSPVEIWFCKDSAAVLSLLHSEAMLSVTFYMSAEVFGIRYVRPQVCLQHIDSATTFHTKMTTNDGSAKLDNES